MPLNFPQFARGAYCHCADERRDFERRAEDAAKRAEREARWWTAGVPIVGALIGVIGTIVAAYVFTVSSVHDVEKRMIENKSSLDIDISKINSKLDDQNLAKRIDELERLVKKAEPRSPKP